MVDKVLVVDDDVETLRLITIMLQRQGFQILTAGNGSQAITLANAEQPNLMVLDIMMPDLDGYAVMKEIRSNPKTTHIPVLMFTARGQVEDKVNGYEAGADDYLTKPVHPTELVAHIRSLLGRTKTRVPEPVEKGYMVAVVAPRGGIGASSLALNLAISYHMETKQSIIAAEMRPGQGTWALDLGIEADKGLENLLRMEDNPIDAEAIERELIESSYGVRLLPCSNRLEALQYTGANKQMNQVVKHLPRMAPAVFLDIGSCYLPDTLSLLSHCNEVLLVTEPYPWTAPQTCQRIQELRDIGFGTSRILTVVMNNRICGDLMLTQSQMTEKLGEVISIGFPPSPEIAYQANLRLAPLIMIQPDGLLAKQYQRLAQSLATRVNG